MCSGGLRLVPFSAPSTGEAAEGAGASCLSAEFATRIFGRSLIAVADSLDSSTTARPDCGDQRFGRKVARARSQTEPISNLGFLRDLNECLRSLKATARGKVSDVKRVGEDS